MPKSRQGARQAKRCRSLLALTASLAFVASPAAAVDILQECDGPTPLMTACIWDAYEAADRALDEVWQEALDSIDQADHLEAATRQEWRMRLVAAQGAWTEFRQEDCNGATAYEWYGGTGANSAVGACLYDATVARTADLRARYPRR